MNDRRGARSSSTEYSPHGNDLPETVGKNSRPRLGKRFSRNQHVMRVCMQQRLRVAHDPDMPLPEDKITAPQIQRLFQA
jgi:hypothetical protein